MVITLKHGASKEQIQKVLDKISKNAPSKGVDLTKYAGTIRLKEDALDVQKRMRDEWK